VLTSLLWKHTCDLMLRQTFDFSLLEGAEKL
jgi:hypothetical protein